jgi:hypothetical protein
MSTDPTGAESRFKSKTYYHLKLNPKDWCIHLKGVCGIEDNIGELYCWACQYRKPLDIPNLLAERGRK